MKCPNIVLTDNFHENVKQPPSNHLCCYFAKTTLPAKSYIEHTAASRNDWLNCLVSPIALLFPAWLLLICCFQRMNHQGTHRGRDHCEKPQRACCRCRGLMIQGVDLQQCVSQIYIMSSRERVLCSTVVWRISCSFPPATRRMNKQRKQQNCCVKRPAAS